MFGSGRDTVVAGANLQARDIIGTVGGNLVVASVQNQLHSSNKSGSGSVTVGPAPGGSFSAASGKTDRSFTDDVTSVIGTESVDIAVGGNTHIKGAVIANAENGVDKGNLVLNTGTLTFEDIIDSDKSQQKSISASYSKGGVDAQGKTVGAIPGIASGGFASSNTQGITRATVGNGLIVVREGELPPGEGAIRTDIANLNRDITNVQEITKSSEHTYSIAVPLATVDSLQTGAKEIKTATVSASKLLAEGVGGVARSITDALVKAGELSPDSKEKVDIVGDALRDGKVTREQLAGCAAGGAAWNIHEFFIADAYADSLDPCFFSFDGKSVQLTEKDGKSVLSVDASIQEKLNSDPDFASGVEFGNCLSDPACSQKMLDATVTQVNGVLLVTGIGDVYALSTAGARLYAEGGIKAVIEGAKSGLTGLFVKSEGVVVLADKAAARSALDGSLGQAANNFFKGAKSISKDFKITDLPNGQKQLEFFDPARSVGYGKRYVKVIDSSGNTVRYYKETISPQGILETKWLQGGN